MLSSVSEDVSRLEGNRLKSFIFMNGCKFFLRKVKLYLIVARVNSIPRTTARLRNAASK